jgi:hypothetical protein
MTSETVGFLFFAAAAVLVVAMLCAAALVAWRGWLQFKRLELQQRRQPGQSDLELEDVQDTGALIELASMKERLRRLEAIASGVEL